MSGLARWPWVKSWLAGLCLVFVSSPLYADGAEDLLSVVRTAQRSARESIRTFSATINVKTTFPEEAPLISGKYWRSLNRARVREGSPGSGTDDYLVTDSEIRQVGISAPKQSKRQHVATRRPATSFLCICDVWREMLVDFQGPDGPQCDFDRYIELAKSPPRAKRERLEGRECIRLDLDFEMSSGTKIHSTLWHDPSYNYFVTKKVVDVGSEHRNEVEIAKFVEFAPGIFFPTEAHYRTFRKGKLTGGRLSTLSEVRVNQPIPDSQFLLPAIPRGTVLHDRIKGTAYPVDESWRPIGPEKAERTTTVIPSRAERGAEYRSQSSEEPTSLIRWLIPASLAILALAGSYGLYRRYSAQRAQGKGGT